MSALSSREWRQISTRLDEALEVPEAERASWLAALRKKNPTLASQLETLLREHSALAEEGFLEKHRVALPKGRGFAGQTIGTYQLVSSIGHGGMGSVWLGERVDGRFHRQVAIKFLNISWLGQTGEDRFRREGSILARLDHPNIAKLVDAGVSPSGQPYLMMEYVEGGHIDRYCDQRTLDVPSRIQLFLQVLAGVAHAHHNLIVHRDIKPSNVLVRTDGQVKLVDFGIAKLLADESEAEQTTVTVDGVRPMTPGYAAPEQLQGGAITMGTDVYALGVLLYELLTGQHPGGSSVLAPAELVKVVVEKEPLRPSVAVAPLGPGIGIAERAARRGTTPEKLRRSLQGDLDTIIAKALKKEPAERYPSVTAFADDLHRHLKNQPISARPDALAYRAAKFVRRHRVSLTLAMLAILAIFAGAWGTWIQARTARRQRDFALRQLRRAERLNGLNQFLLSDAAPLGKPLTANELLEREEEIVQREHYDDAADHVELLLSLGNQYSGEEENRSARRVLEQAYQLSRGVQDRSTRARASCELAWTRVPMGDLAGAESLFQQGMSELPRGEQFAAVRAQCLMRGTEIAFRNGNAHEVKARALAAERALNASPVRSPVEELEVLTAVAGAYGTAGQFREANIAFERASDRMSTLGYDNTQKAVKLFNDWGLILSDAGRPLEAERAYRRAIEVSRSNQRDDAVLPALLHNYSGVLRDLGRLDEAADYANRAHERAQEVGDQILTQQTLLQLARVYRDQHDFAQATAILAEIEPRIRRMIPPGHYAFAALTSDKATLAYAEGDLPTALRLANRAVALDESSIKAGGQGAVYLPSLLVRRSMIELDSGDAPKAEADSARAVELLIKAMQPGTTSSKLGHAYLALGRAQKAQGKTEEAQSVLRQAAENLKETVGPNHPDTRSAGQLADELASRH